MPNSSGSSPKAAVFLGSTQKELSSFDVEVKSIFGHALYLAQCGETHEDATAMKGFGGAAKVMEVSFDHGGDTYRAMYTTKIGHYVFVLHTFKKKSTKGIATPQKDLDLIMLRLKDATKLHAQWVKECKREKN